MRGEKTKIHSFYIGKTISVEIVNLIDRRMLNFMNSKWNYHPKVSSKTWVKDNHVTDKRMIHLLGWKVFSSLSLEERIELKAIFMVRQYVWKQFHIWNRQFNNRWAVKIADDTDFKITIK